MPTEVEERASAYNLQHDVEISQNERPSRVGTTVNGRYEAGETSAAQSPQSHSTKESNS